MPSRRVQGQWSEDGEGRGYSDVIICAEKGLGGQDRLFRDILSTVAHNQTGEVSRWGLHCFSFGHSKDDLKHPGKGLKVANPQMAMSRKQALCELAGEKQPDGKSLIPRLFPKTGMNALYAGKSHPNRDDLLIFVCRDQNSFELSDDVNAKLENRSLSKHVFWVYVNDGEVEVEKEKMRRNRAKEEHVCQE